METHIDCLLHRSKRVNFEFNHSDKYIEQFKTDEYYTKIGNRLDDLLRISYFLVKFYISTPPKYKPSKNSNINGELLTPYEEDEVEVPAPLEYNDEHFSLYTLNDLPAEIESEFDFNYFAFYSFLSYLKPSLYFINDYELIPKGRIETKREKVTRVLSNLVLLLSFIRSFDEKHTKDIMIVISSLFSRFEKLFTISHDDSYENYVFFQEYPNQAALYSIFLLLYDDQSLDDLKENVHLMFTTYENIPECDDYRTALQAHKFALDSLLKSSESSEDFKTKLSDQYKLSDFKESLFKLSKTLANKIIIEVLELSTVDLNRSFLSINYENELVAREEEIKSIESKTKEVAEQEKAELRKSLLEEIQSKEREINILNQELKLRDESYSDLEKQLDDDAKKRSGALTSFTSESHFKEVYPELYKSISSQGFKMASHKFYGQLNELEDRIAKFKATERRQKEEVDNLRRKIEELTQQQQEHQEEEVIEAPPHWNYQKPQPPPQPQGPNRGGFIEEIRPSYGGRNGFSYEDNRRGGDYYQPNPPAPVKYNGNAGHPNGYRPPPQPRYNY